jgi:inosine/xanthosine triphosphatase
MRVIVGSTNPVKIQAARQGFEQMFPEVTWEVTGVSVASGVSDQPMGDDETLRGALNRAEAVRQAHPEADYTVGIEGGCGDEPDGSMTVFAWIVVESKHGKIGRSKTGLAYLPDEVAVLIRAGLELGDADDKVFGRSNSKQQNGSIGLLTGDVVQRDLYYTQSVIMALIPFKNPNLTFK